MSRNSDQIIATERARIINRIAKRLAAAGRYDELAALEHLSPGELQLLVNLETAAEADVDDQPGLALHAVA